MFLPPFLLPVAVPAERFRVDFTGFRPLRPQGPSAGRLLPGAVPGFLCYAVSRLGLV